MAIPLEDICHWYEFKNLWLKIIAASSRANEFKRHQLMRYCLLIYRLSFNINIQCSTERNISPVSETHIKELISKKILKNEYVSNSCSSELLCLWIQSHVLVCELILLMESRFVYIIFLKHWIFYNQWFPLGFNTYTYMTVIYIADCIV